MQDSLHTLDHVNLALVAVQGRGGFLDWPMDVRGGAESADFVRFSLSLERRAWCSRPPAEIPHQEAFLRHGILFIYVIFH